MALVLMAGGTAQADDISFSGGVGISQSGTLSSPAVNFTFFGMTVTPGTLGGDALEGTAVSITPDTAFSFTSISGGAGLFSPNSGTITLGNSILGTITGDIDFVMITSTGVPGSFAIQVALSNLNITPGTSGVISALVGSQNGTGVLTFQFTAPSGTTLFDLLTMGLGVGTLGDVNSMTRSMSGSVAVPEPASLALLGSGLLMGGGFIRRKFLKA